MILRRRDQLRRRGRPAAFDRDTYRRRNVVERRVGWLQENRRLGTRFEKLAVNYLANAKLAMVQRYLRLLRLRDRT